MTSGYVPRFMNIVAISHEDRATPQARTVTNAAHVMVFLTCPKLWAEENTRCNLFVPSNTGVVAGDPTRSPASAPRANALPTELAKPGSSLRQNYHNN